MMVRWLVVALAISVCGCEQKSAAPKDQIAFKLPPTKPLPIEPSSLGNLPPVELSALIYDAMPPANVTALKWDHMLNAPVRWITAGYDTTEGGQEVRDGKARVRVGGRLSTVLRESKEELPWTVELSSMTNPGLGVQEITLQAGGNEGDQCFGSLYDNCTFTPDEAFSSEKFKAQFLCQIGPLSSFVRYYRLTSPGRADMMAAYRREDASGGSSTELALSLPHLGENLCAKGAS